MHRTILALTLLLLSVGCSHQPRITLFNGHDTSHWVMKDGSPCKWTINPEGALEAAPKTGDIYTKEKFTDYTLHLEFRTPLPAPGDKGQHRGNSGVFMQSLYEIQILESFGINPPTKGDCAAIYNIKPPDKNVAKPPMEWQTYDITYKAPRFDKAGAKTKNAVVTVKWNGTVVHNKAEIPHPTRDPKLPEPPGPAPLELQDHGFEVQFRNIWIQPQ